jgi:nucleobase:cation symporter-1, NCS1 family
MTCLYAEGGASKHLTIASSMIDVGLSWRLAIGACVLGNTIMGLVITVNGRVGAKVSLSHMERERPD